MCCFLKHVKVSGRHRDASPDSLCFSSESTLSDNRTAVFTSEKMTSNSLNIVWYTHSVFRFPSYLKNVCSVLMILGSVCFTYSFVSSLSFKLAVSSRGEFFNHTLFMFGAEPFCVVHVVLCVVGCSAGSLPCPRLMQVAPTWSHRSPDTAECCPHENHCHRAVLDSV